MLKTFNCIICNQEILVSDLGKHKKKHEQERHYGIMWPICSCPDEIFSEEQKIPIHTSDFLARLLGVKKVYIRDEGQNISGSMKDYIVKKAIKIGLDNQFSAFTVVSSGNHAASLAKLTNFCGLKSIVFCPASSSKIPYLSTFSNSIVIGVKDAIFEDVYVLANTITLDGVYNANVSNEMLLTAFRQVSLDISQINPLPTHIFSGVGNGSYLAGITWGFERIPGPTPKVVPVGMNGAFPTEYAFNERKNLHEYDDFLVPEDTIDAAEGSIAIASYSMPQLMHALKLSGGFPLGGLTNQDLKRAYQILIEEEELLSLGAIPEPTGIMGLAAAIKHKNRFSSKDILLISFTGHGIKDEEGIKKVIPESFDYLMDLARKNRPDLATEFTSEEKTDNVLLVEKNISSKELNKKIQTKIQGG